MYYDLNVPWSPNQSEFCQRIKFLTELGYNVLAASHLLPTKLPSDLTSPIKLPPAPQTPKRTRILTRCTLPLLPSSQNPGARIAELRQHYDILALRPTDEKTLLQACSTLDCDIISLNLSLRYQFHFRPRTFTPALARGIKIELCYGAAVTGGDAEQRRNVLANAAEIIRSTRGRGILISGEVGSVLGARAPHDVVNLAVLWGLKQEMGMEAVGDVGRSVVAAAQLRRNSFRGAVEVVQIQNGGLGIENEGEGEGDGESSVAFEPPAQLTKRRKEERKQRDEEVLVSKTADETTEIAAVDPLNMTKKQKKLAKKRKAEEAAATETGDAASTKKVKT